MTTTPEPLRQARDRVRGPLARHLAALAGTPDDASGINERLSVISRHAADELPPVSFASVTASRGDAFTTVAASGSLAEAVDEAQYADGTGPCLDALHDGAPIGVPDIATTMRWPRFRESAIRLGLRASLSIPLFAGSGTTVAALNLYGRDTDAMAPLIEQVWAVYNSSPDPERTFADLSPGENDLVVGLEDAFAIRAVIQQAIGALMARRQCSAADAYLHLRVHAAGTTTGLLVAATDLLDHLS